MKKIILFIAIISIFITGCTLKKEESIKKYKTVKTIEIDKKQYIKQLKPVKIENTNDYVTITSKVKWKIPKHKKGETISFSIDIPYIITIDEIKYKGIYQLNDYNSNTMDNNPKYDFRVTNLTKNGDIEILITKK